LSINSQEVFYYLLHFTQLIELTKILSTLANKNIVILENPGDKKFRSKMKIF